MHDNNPYVDTSRAQPGDMHASSSRATGIRASAGEVLAPLHAETGGGRVARTAAAAAAAVRAQPVICCSQRHRRRRRLPVALPLVDEPVVDLLRVEPRRLRQRRLLQLLHAWRRRASSSVALHCMILHACMHVVMVRTEG